MICVATTAKAYSLIVWDWRSNKAVTSLQLTDPVDRVTFSPDDAGCIAVSGPQYIRLLKLLNVGSRARDASLQLEQPFAGLREDVTINDHCWADPADGTLLCCTSGGAVHVLDSTKVTLQATLEPVFHDTNEYSSVMVLTIRCFSRGFIAAGAEGTISVWEKVDSAPSGGADEAAASTSAAEYKHARTVQLCETDAGIRSVDFCGSEEFIAFSFENGDISVMTATQVYSAEEIDCQAINGGFHGGPILGLDIAAQRPLAASLCMKDSSVRIWNHNTRQCELHWRFQEAPVALAMHPLGYLVAVAFAECICIFHLLLRELKLYREVPMMKSCQAIQFSNGGHMLAASVGNEIIVIGTKDFRPIAKVNSSEGDSAQFSSFCFARDDSTLLGCTEAGTLISWKTESWDLLNEKKDQNQKNRTEFAALAFGPDNVAFCGVRRNSKCLLEQVQDGNVDQKLELREPNVRGASISAICCHSPSGALFIGTSTGSIWGYPGAAVNAFQGNSLVSPTEVRGVFQGLHSGPCTCIRLTSDGRTLLSAGKDGAIYISEVQGIASGGGAEDGAADAQRGSLLGAIETVLIGRDQIQQRKTEMLQLREEHTMLTFRRKDEIENAKGEGERKLAEARQKDLAEIRELRRRCSNLEIATAAKERESKRISEAMDRSHAINAEQLANLYEKKLEYESDQYVAMQLDQHRVQEEVDQNRLQGKKQLEVEGARFQEELLRQLEEKELEVQKHKDMIAFAQHRFDRIIEGESKDQDLEIAAAKITRHQEVQKLKQTEEKLRREQAALMKGLEMMEKDRAKAAKDQHEAITEIERLKLQAEELSRTVASLKMERKEREGTLGEKEKKIENYQQKINKLKKFRHVLDQQLLDVTETLAPKNHLINQLNEHLLELETEFEGQIKEQRSLEEQTQERVQQIDLLASEEKALRGEVTERDRVIARFSNDLHQLVTEVRDVKQWPAEIRRMYHTYVCGEVDYNDRLPLEEAQQHMRLLEGQVTSLSAKGNQSKATCKVDERRKAHEGAVLIGELNTLRVDRKNLSMNIKVLEAKLNGLKAQLAREAAEGLAVTNGAGGSVALSSSSQDRHAIREAGAARGSELRPEGAGGPVAWGSTVDEDTSSSRASSAKMPLPPGLAPGSTIPRMPSGTLPGPRQQQSLRPASATASSREATRRTQPKSIEAAAPIALQQKGISEDMMSIDSLRKAAQAQHEQLKAHNLENDRLRDQLQTLTRRNLPASKSGEGGSSKRRSRQTAVNA
jgi:WD40 repeat protein